MQFGEILPLEQDDGRCALNGAKIHATLSHDGIIDHRSRLCDVPAFRTGSSSNRCPVSSVSTIDYRATPARGLPLRVMAFALPAFVLRPGHFCGAPVN